MSLEDMSNFLNVREVQQFEAVASEGLGVFATWMEINRRVIEMAKADKDTGKIARM